MEWIEDIIDIREQFPLNREVTYNIAKEKGFVILFVRKMKR